MLAKILENNSTIAPVNEQKVQCHVRMLLMPFSALGLTPVQWREMKIAE